jgi:hypothetical protein
MTGFCTNYITPLSLDIMYGRPRIFTFYFLGIMHHFYHRIFESCQKVPEYHTYIPPRNAIFDPTITFFTSLLSTPMLNINKINRGY